MSVDLLPVLCPVRVPWNKGRIIGQKRPLLPRHVWSICVRLEMAGNVRDLALFNMAVDSMLRGAISSASMSGMSSPPGESRNEPR
jgi:hypothetical protein